MKIATTRRASSGVPSATFTGALRYGLPLQNENLNAQVKGAIQMKIFLCLAISMLCLGIVAWAQQDAEYQGWMKSNGASVASLRKNLDAKQGDAAAADAKTLEEDFGHVYDYWQKKNVSDAMKFAQDGQNAFKQVAELAAAGKFDDASAALKTGQATCAGCHMAHREKAPDGSWKMK
ncbi:MAG TPA: hypothetical protein VFC37_04135 [Terracidiphilus sp.]|nr:hypothetical protein [Terracidiphilus sp.]